MRMRPSCEQNWSVRRPFWHLRTKPNPRLQHLRMPRAMNGSLFLGWE